MDNKDDLELIDRYYLHQLDEVERQEFEKRMSEDADFKAEVFGYEEAIQAVRLYGRAAMKKRLQERPLIKKPRRIKYWFWIGLSVTVILICAYLFLPSNQPKPDHTPPVDPSQIDATNPREQQAVITIPDTPASHTKPPKTIIKTNQLFAEAYQPYKEGSGSTLGSPQPSDSSDLANIRRLKKLAEEEKYEESLVIYNQLSQEFKDEEVALFYKANSLLALDSIGEAATLFNKLALKSNGTYASQAQWYSALCALKNKKLPEVKQWLGMIIAKDSYATKELRKKANTLMGKLK
ncbi:MAG: hypothetical protein R2791_21270 [Saprospiraceae bacterium]